MSIECKNYLASERICLATNMPVICGGMKKECEFPTRFKPLILVQPILPPHEKS